MYRNSVIDAWRAVAALAVVVLHARLILWIGIRQYASQFGLSLSLESLLAYSTFPAAFGGMGVAIFFVLSGYCIHVGHARKLAKDGNYNIDCREFVLRRALRIYPPLLFAIAVTFVFDTISYAITPGNPDLGDHGTLTLAVNILTLQNLLGPSYGTDGVLWSLSVEIHLYLAYLALFLLRRRFGLQTLVMVVIAINAVSLWLTKDSGTILFTNYLTVWWAGAIVAEVDWSSQRPLRTLTLLGALIFAVGCGLHLLGLNLAAFTLCGLGFALLLGPSIIARGQRCWLVEPLARIGAFSYSIYLVHVPFFVLVGALFYGGVKQVSIFPAMYFTVAAIAFAYGCHLIAERPALAALRARSRRSAKLAA